MTQRERERRWRCLHRAQRSAIPQLLQQAAVERVAILRSASQAGLVGAQPCVNNLSWRVPHRFQCVRDMFRTGSSVSGITGARDRPARYNAADYKVAHFQADLS